ncbi:MAG: hypothetical protein OXT67_08215, partial [Zetaproteobacteria bacterium]|nr:hypothetical protein [Zetaproteobacteria bacterium]
MITDLVTQGNRYIGGIEGFLGLGVIETYADYQKLGTAAPLYTRDDNTDIQRNFKWDWISQKEMDVARIDSYLYAATSILWQSYGNILLNGGFMSPEVKITSKLTTVALREVSGNHGTQDYDKQPYE